MCDFELILPRFLNIYFIDATAAKTIETDLRAIFSQKEWVKRHLIGLLGSGRDDFSCSITLMTQPSILASLSQAAHTATSPSLPETVTLYKMLQICDRASNFLLWVPIMQLIYSSKS